MKKGQGILQLYKAANPHTALMLHKSGMVTVIGGNPLAKYSRARDGKRALKMAGYVYENPYWYPYPLDNFLP